MNSRYGIIITLASAAIFGLWPPAASLAYAEGSNPAFMILLTTFARAGSLALFCVFTQRRLYQTASDVHIGLLGGGLQSISILCLITAVAYLPGSIVMIILFTHTLMLLFLMSYKREVKLDVITVATTVAALIGLSLVVDVWHAEARYSLFGIALAFTAAVATANRAYVYGHQTKTKHAAVVGAEAFLFSAVIIIIPALLMGPALPISMSGYAWALVGTASLVVGTFGLFYGIAMIGAFRFSLFLKLEPVFTAIFSFFLLNEVLDWGQYIGMLIVIASLAAYQLHQHKQSSRAA